MWAVILRSKMPTWGNAPAMVYKLQSVNLLFFAFL